MCARGLAPTLGNADSIGERVGDGNGVCHVPRHNGLEAWRRLAEPVNDDTVLLQKDFLPKVTKPKAAPSADLIEQAIEDWDTDIRLFVKAGGRSPLDDARRLTLIQILGRRCRIRHDAHGAS